MFLRPGAASGDGRRRRLARRPLTCSVTRFVQRAAEFEKQNKCFRLIAWNHLYYESPPGSYEETRPWNRVDFLTSGSGDARPRCRATK